MSEHPSQLVVASSRRKVPAWVMSVALHCGAALVLGWALQAAPRGAEVEPTREASIVLSRSDQAQREYFREDIQPSEPAAAASSLSEALPAAGSPPTDVAATLPSLSDEASPGFELADALPGAAALTSGRRRGPQIDGSARTGVFGVEGEGSKFIYVFDRSGSMDDYQGRPLAAAKRELIASLQDLDSRRQFQIVFYNQEPDLCNPHHLPTPRLLYGTDRDRQAAIDYVKRVSADGGTKHLPAILAALRMSPDVIFFLSDAAGEALSAADLERVRRRNRRVGAAIHTIEFGSGPYQGDINFLVRLARQNNGRHAYVDVTRLP